MARQYSYFVRWAVPRWTLNSFGYPFMGRPQTAPRLSWHKLEYAHGWPDVPDGTLCDVTPAPGRTYTRRTFPPRGRGRGESLMSPRRIEAKLRALRVIQLRACGCTYAVIARRLGFRDGSGAYRAMK